jgi:hypothetical protein
MTRLTVGRATGVLALLAVAYVAWPFWSGWQLRQAMRARDVASLQARVDWTTLRTNLKPRLAAAIEQSAKDSGGVMGYLKGLLSGTVTNKGVDYLVTPQTLSRVLAGREFVTNRMKRDPAQDSKSAKQAPPTAEADPEDPDDPMPPRRLRWAFFESPTRFRIEAVHPRLPGARIVAHLGLQGVGWQLVDVNIVER